MKAKLLKRLRSIGRGMITVHTITTTGNTITGMSYGYDYDEYAGLFSYGNTEQEVKEKACQVYLQTNIESIRKKYGKYSKGYLNR